MWCLFGVLLGMVLRSKGGKNQMGEAFITASHSSGAPGMNLQVAPLKEPHYYPAAFSRSTPPYKTLSDATVPTSLKVLPLCLLGIAALSVAMRQQGRASKVTRQASLVATRPDQVIPWWDRMCRPRMEKGIGIWAEKLNMTTWFEESGGNVKALGATVLVVKRGGNYVTEKRWPERHGLYGVEVGYERYVPDDWEKNHTKRGRFIQKCARLQLPPLRKFKSFRLRPQEWVKWNLGQKVWPSDFLKEGDFVDVHGRSKGKGYQGRIRRWGQKRGPMTHGSRHHRRHGSVGAKGIARVLPGLKMDGWMGDKMHTDHHRRVLKIIDHIDEDNMPESIIIVEGSVPGYTAHWKAGGSYLTVHKAHNRSDGRFKMDPVYMWYAPKNGDSLEVLPGHAWTLKTMYGRDIRWYKHEVKKYWPDGYPGYDHSADPFYDDCDPKLAIKAPEW